MPTLPIVLTGMMLSGKTTVGRRLAARLGCPFFDLDDEIERITGKSIPDWFAEGEAGFRDIEARVLSDLLSAEGLRVIATGGGAMERAESRRSCCRNGFVVYLEATPMELASRGDGMTGRPLLDDSSDPARTLAELLHKREANYLEAQHLRLPAGRLDTEELVEAIIRGYAKHAAG